MTITLIVGIVMGYLLATFIQGVTWEDCKDEM